PLPAARPGGPGPGGAGPQPPRPVKTQEIPPRPRRKGGGKDEAKDGGAAPEEAQGGAADLVGEAEALRSLLRDAAARAGRLPAGPPCWPPASTRATSAGEVSVKRRLPFRVPAPHGAGRGGQPSSFAAAPPPTRGSLLPIRAKPVLRREPCPGRAPRRGRRSRR